MTQFINCVFSSLLSNRLIWDSFSTLRIPIPSPHHPQRIFNKEHTSHCVVLLSQSLQWFLTPLAPLQDKGRTLKPLITVPYNKRLMKIYEMPSLWEKQNLKTRNLCNTPPSVFSAPSTLGCNPSSSSAFPDHRLFFFPHLLPLNMPCQPEWSVVNRYFQQKRFDTGN